MTLFRNTLIIRFLTTVAAVTFLNLSFFLTELSAIDLNHQNHALYECLVKTYFTICEEEKDPNGSETSENESFTKEIDLLLNSTFKGYAGYYIMITKRTYFQVSHPSDGASFTIHQPPEVLA